MSALKKSPRPQCVRCLRPKSHCLCAHICVVPNRIKVLVLQHPDESKHPLNTARLAVLGLQNAELWIGESFPQLTEQLKQVEATFLLFPSQEQSRIQPLAPIPAALNSLLIVPDGTWRNVRKIINTNPVLSTLPHLSLAAAQPSQYRVRKAREAAAVSTVEAIVRALTSLEPEGEFLALLRPFNALIEQQIQAMGTEVYQRNYQRKDVSY